MASGKTIVVSNIIGINEVIIGGHNGLLFRIDDHQELTRQVSVFLRNPELRKTFGERARRDVSERLNIKTSIDKVFNIYQQLLKLSN
jgi:glycosyltransferase involved in cell wall biosynthesis